MTRLMPKIIRLRGTNKRPRRLTVTRRAYEYNHQYGLTLLRRAVPRLHRARRHR